MDCDRQRDGITHQRSERPQQRIYIGPFRYNNDIFRNRRKYGRWSVKDGIPSLLLALKRSTSTKEGIPCRKHEGIMELKDGISDWTGLDWTVLQIVQPTTPVSRIIILRRIRSDMMGTELV